MTSLLDENEYFDTQDHLKRLKAGSVLLSGEALKDPNFDSSVVLICVHNSEGTYGLVLNRVAHMPLGEIFEGLNSLQLNREIFMGGPVRQEELQILQITNNAAEGAFEILPGYYLGGKWDDFSQIIESDPASVKFFLGYSGWSPGQLESEIKAGAWYVYNVALEKLFAHTEKLSAEPISDLARYLNTISTP